MFCRICGPIFDAEINIISNTFPATIHTCMIRTCGFSVEVGIWTLGLDCSLLDEGFTPEHVWHFRVNVVFTCFSTWEMKSGLSTLKQGLADNGPEQKYSATQNQYVFVTSLSFSRPSNLIPRIPSPPRRKPQDPPLLPSTQGS